MSPKVRSAKKQCCAKDEKLIEDRHIFELSGGVNPKFQITCSQVTSQDPLPPIGTMFALLWGEESCRMVMDVK